LTSFERAIQLFTADGKLKTVAIFIVVDFLLGVAAAIASGTFRLSYVADFLRKDVLGKVFPWAVIYLASKMTTEDLPGGISFETVATAVFVAVIAALGGSILASLAGLGLFGDKGKNAATGGVVAPAATPSPVIKALAGPEEPKPLG
jgi:hypothetical protein